MAILLLLLRGLLAYVAIAVTVGAFLDPTVHWIAALAFSAMAIGLFLALLVGVGITKNQPLHHPGRRPHALVFFVALSGLSAFFAYEAVTVQWERIHRISAIHKVVTAYAGAWSSVVFFVLLAAVFASLALRTYRGAS